MKVVILAGGLGTRLSEETVIKPKPMVEIGGHPIIWHIMKIYSHYGFRDFIICLGYNGYIIKEFFSNYFLHNSDITIDLESNTIEYHKNKSENWKISLVDTGVESMTGGRVKRIQEFTEGKPFLLTYGDGVSDVNIKELLELHKQRKKICTVTAVPPPGRFGILDINSQGFVDRFIEKPQNNQTYINGGFFVCEPEVFQYIEDDATIFEKEPLENLASKNQLNSYIHSGFWKPMDTIRDKIVLEELWKKNKAPWKIWK